MARLIIRKAKEPKAPGSRGGVGYRSKKSGKWRYGDPEPFDFDAHRHKKNVARAAGREALIERMRTRFYTLPSDEGHGWHVIAAHPEHGETIVGTYEDEASAQDAADHEKRQAQRSWLAGKPTLAQTHSGKEIPSDQEPAHAYRSGQFKDWTAADHTDAADVHEFEAKDTPPGETKRVVHADGEKDVDARAHHLASAEYHRGHAHRLSKPKKPRLTPEQRKALDEYNFRLREEDRYMGSVFASPIGQRRVEARTREAYERCKRLGMTHEHGL